MGDIKDNVIADIVSNSKQYCELMHEIHEGIQDGVVNRHKRFFPLKTMTTVNDLIGGFKRGELVIIGGRPSNGKSALMISIAFDLAAAGYKVHFFSLEMTLKSMGERLYCSNLGIDSQKLYKEEMLGIMQTKQFNERLVTEFSQNQNIRFTLSDSLAKEIDDVIGMLELESDTEIIFIDYIQMIKNFMRNTKESIDEYIKTLREIAIRKNMCVIVGSQINRGGVNDDDKIPGMHELKSTGALEEVADVVMIIHYPHKHDESKPKDQIVLKVAKNRSGPTGILPLLFSPETGKIQDWKNVTAKISRS